MKLIIALLFLSFQVFAVSGVKGSFEVGTSLTATGTVTSRISLSLKNQTATPTAVSGYAGVYAYGDQLWFQNTTTGTSAVIAAISRNQVAYIEDVKAQNVSAGSASAGYNQRVINTLTGDTSFVSLSGGTTGTGGTANVFTITQAGTYEIDVEAPAYTIGAHRVGIATSASGTPDVKVGTSEHAITSSSNVWSRVTATVTISGSTAYKILDYCTNPGAGAGLGYATNVIGPEVYTRVKITKMNGSN